MNEPLLALRRLRKAFDGVPALTDGCLELRAGEVHALVGENGAGKSTLMRILAGALASDGGEMRLRGAVHAPQSPRDAFGAGVHLVHQELMLVDELSVAENLFLGREPTRGAWLDRPAMERAAAVILERLGVRRRPGDRLADLPLGERQLVEVGRVLTHEVDVLAMDEPTATLTEVEAERLFEVVADLRSRGVGVIWISHRLEEIGRVCDRVTTMRDGAHVRTSSVAEYPRDEIVRDMVGRPVRVGARAQPCRSVGEALLELRGFSDGRRYRDVDLVVRRGEILGLFGLVGAGRTELAHGVIGAPPPEAGSAWLDGAPFRAADPRDALHHGVGMLTEDRKGCGIVPDRSLAENISLSSLDSLTTAGFLRLGDERKLAGGYRDDLSIRAASLDAAIRTLSGGNQQKVLIARLLATGARVLIVDEPTRGVDVGAKAEIHALLARLVEEGRAILMIGSDLPELLTVADRIVVMREGRIAGELSDDAATPEAVMALATGTSTAEAGR